ncbi:MAG: TRAP transporter large permease subunit, partial [bacterium]
MTEKAPQASAGRVVELGPALTGVCTALAISLTLASLAWAADLFRPLGLVLFNEQHIAIALTLAMPLLYLTVPARKGPRTWVPWYDMVAAVLGALTSAYIAVRYPVLVDTMMEYPPDALIVSLIMFVLCLEGLRRTVGKALVVVSLLLFGYAMVGHLVPGVLQTKEVTAQRLIIYLGLETSAMMGVPMLIVATIVIGFVFFGQTLLKSGGSEFFNDLALALMGRFRGGSAKISIVASSFFGSISGIVVSNIM